MSRIMHVVSQRVRSSARVAAAVAALLVSANVAEAQRTWAGFLRGTNEVPANASPATGYVTISLSNSTLTVLLNWTGLIGGNPAAGHIHCCTAPGSNVGVAVGFPNLPATASGSYTGVFDLTDPTVYTAGFRNNFGGGTAAGAEAALIAGLDAGNAYVNLHNARWPGGEIRANVTTTPEPGTVALLAVGMLAVGVVARNRRRAA